LAIVPDQAPPLIDCEERFAQEKPLTGGPPALSESSAWIAEGVPPRLAVL
jgi:hypothetical protein